MPNIKLGNHLSLGSIHQTEIQPIKRVGMRGGRQKPPRQLFQEDKLSGERILAGSLAVGRNWDPEEILDIKSKEYKHYPTTIYTGLV